jgi:hypothetical protein
MHTTRKIVQNVDLDQSAARHSHCYQDLEAQSGTECHFMLQVTALETYYPFVRHMRLSERTKLGT